MITSVLNFFFTIFLFAAIVLILIAMAKYKKYFNLPVVNDNSNVRLKHVLSFFLVYITAILFSSFILSFLFSFFNFKTSSGSINIIFLSTFNLTYNLSILLGFIFLGLIFGKNFLKNIIKDKNSVSSYKKDILIGVIFWFLAFPSVIFVYNILEKLIYQIFKLKEMPDQSAIRYLKSSYGNVTHFTIALISILVFAPIIEEFLFRGILQSYLRKLGRYKGIILTSICFSVFHFSFSQGYSNILIIASLFTLSCFLGFLYEKQQSLISPIILHSIFNGVTVLNLFLFKETI